MQKRGLRLTFDDLYFLPVESENIYSGWLEWMNNPEITRYLSAKSKAYTAQDLLLYLDADDSMAFLACYRDLDDAYLGNLRIYQVAPGVMSFGRLIGETRFHGHGYGTKLNEVALELCFRWFDAKVVVVGNHKENKASFASKMKSGFTSADSAFLEKWNLNIENAVYMERSTYLNR
jgi:RimJ/RimL family protein N-acetyltransferase